MVLETYRDQINNLDISDQNYLKKSKIEAIYEKADLFFFSKY